MARSIDAMTGAAPPRPSGTSVYSNGTYHNIGSVVQNFDSGFRSGVGSIVSSAREALSTPSQPLGYDPKLIDPSGPYGPSGLIANPASSGYFDPYPFADIGKLYNVDAKTAYQEALSNTAVQRQMDDFKRAGLNPMLATRYGGADGVGLVGNVAGVGAGLANTSGATAGGGSGFSSPGSTSGRGGSARGLSSILNYASKNYNIQSAVASLASAATFGITKSFQGSAAVYYGVKGAFGVLNSLRR